MTLLWHLHNSGSSLSSDTITLKELHAALVSRGVVVARTQLAAVMHLDPVPELLSIKGNAARRQIPVGVVDLLATFIPEFQRKRIRWNMFPEALREWLELGGKPEAEIDIAELAYWAGLAKHEEVLTADEAAVFLKTDTDQLRAHFPVTYRIGSEPTGDRWLRSELVRRIRGGNEESEL